MSWLDAFLHRVHDRLGGPRRQGPPSSQSAATAGAGVEFRALFRLVQSDDTAARRRAALLLSSLGATSAIRPLVAAYTTHEDPELLAALRPFGRPVTRVAIAEAREPSVGGRRLARLLSIVGHMGDPAGLVLAREHAAHPDPAVHVAACAALEELGDPAGMEALWRDLEGIRAHLRVTVLRELEGLDTPRSRAALNAHVQRYLATAGAVPEAIEVYSPLLVEPVGDVARLLAERLRHSEASLHLAIGPAAGTIAEEHRGTIQAATHGWQAFYTTPRHTPDEQLELLAAARNRAAADPEARVLLLGPLPSPEGRHPLRHVLTWLPANPYRCRVLFLGPADCAAVMAWWRYVDEVSEVPTTMEVLLDLITLAANRMTEEERIILHHVADGDQGRFARALLGHL